MIDLTSTARKKTVLWSLPIVNRWTFRLVPIHAID